MVVRPDLRPTIAGVGYGYWSIAQGVWLLTICVDRYWSIVTASLLISRAPWKSLDFPLHWLTPPPACSLSLVRAFTLRHVCGIFSCGACIASYPYSLVCVRNGLACHYTSPPLAHAQMCSIIGSWSSTRNGRLFKNLAPAVGGVLSTPG